MSFASLRKVLRSARKGLCSTCSKTRYPQLEAAGAGHVGCLIYTFETLGQLIKDDHDVTAMHVASRKGHITILIYLIENKLVEGIPRAKNGATPAHDAAGTGNLECLRYIITQTISSPNDIDGNNATPLHWAVQGGHLKVVQWLVIEGNAAIDVVTRSGVTPLHIAAGKNNLEIVRWLTLHAYKHHPKPRRLVNAKDRNGATPIYNAAHCGHIKVINWLAEKGGGDPTIFTAQGLAPVHASAIAGHMEAVKYLFQFGSATAPGGLRTTDGASTIHFAAAEGHVDIVKWLLEEAHCTGMERDYYQSTPLHDAAEHGQIKVLEVLFKHGVDHTLTDIEGNTPRDLAVKNGQTKTARYLGIFTKQHVLRRKNGSTTHGITKSHGLVRSRHSRAEIIDNYRNAPPHQIPVTVFDDELDPYDSDSKSEGDEWTTLRDLMDKNEIEELESQVLTTKQKDLSEAEKKRRKLEENMRREKEERSKKRQELLKKEDDYEKELRMRMLAEEQKTTEQSRAEGAYKAVTDKLSKKINLNLSKSGIPARTIALPGSVSAHELSRGIVEKRTKSYEKKSKSGGRKILSKLWSRKIGSKTSNLKTSQSWDSSMSSTLNPYKEPEIDYELEDTIPEPPPTPTVEYLLGKRPINLRKRANQTLKDQIKEGAAKLAKGSKSSGGSSGQSSDDTYDSDGHSSVGSSVGSSKGERDHKHHHKKGTKHVHRKKRSTSKGDAGEDSINRNYNKLRSSPPRLRRDLELKLKERNPTPIPNMIPKPYSVPKSDIIMKKPPIPQRLDFNSSFDEIDKVFEQALGPTSPSSTSPLNSPSSQSSPSSSLETSPVHKAGQAIYPSSDTNHSLPMVAPSSSMSRTVPSSARTNKNKRGGPKLPPHLQNKQVTKQNINMQLTGSNQALTMQKQGTLLAKTAPISRVGSSRNRAKVDQSHHEQKPQISQQFGKVEDGESDMMIDDIELQLDEMKTRLASTSANLMRQPSTIQTPSPEPEDSESDTESDDYSSSSDYTSTSDSDDSSSEDSSDDDKMKNPLTAKLPIMAKNVGMGNNLRGGFNRMRMLSRYPKLFGKKIIKLETIKEIAEEVIYDVKTGLDRAIIYHRIQVERKYTKAWKKYMQIMKTAYRKAEKIIQRKRRDNLAKAFYAWIQVRNIGTVEKGDVDRARDHYHKNLKLKIFRAWLGSQGVNYPIARSASLQWVDAEQRYLSWLNNQLESATGEKVDNISDSLSDGICIIQAVSYAANTKLPKFNPRPKVRLHRQDNWKTAHEYMKTVGINVKGIEPADLANGLEAAIYNMFNNILKWYENRLN